MMRKITMISAFAFIMSITLINAVNAANAPYLPPIDDQTAGIGELWNFDVDALYADPAESYELIDFRPGMTINAATGLISWTPISQNDGGVVTVKAFNTAGESVRSFLVYLSDAIVCSDDIISYWKMDETSGTTYEDFKNGYDAIGLATFNDTVGKVDRAVRFAPLGTTDQGMSVADMQQYDFGRADGFTISLWFNYQGQHTPATVNQVLAARGIPSMTNNHLFYMIAIDAVNESPPKAYFQIRPNSTDEVKDVYSSTSITPGQWYHLVAVYEGKPDPERPIQHIYVNKAHNQRDTYWAANASFDGGTGKDLEIGFWSPYGTNHYPFNGMMDEVVVYNKALSQSEVDQIYSDGFNGKPSCKPGSYFPLVTSIPITTAVQDQLYSYIFEASDYEGGLITLSAEIKPDWLTFYPVSGELTGTPSNLDVGDHTIKLKATDGVTDIFQEFTLTVNNENDPPEITSTPSVTTITQGSPFSYTLIATDSDPGDVVTLSAETIPDWLTFNPATGLLSGTPGPIAAGYSPDTTHQVVLRATDLASAFDEQEVIITVNNINDPPVLASQDQLEFDRGGSGEITEALCNVEDPDDYYPADHTITVVAGDDYTFVGNMVTPDPDFYGNLDVNLDISDGKVTAHEVFVIRVNYVDVEPVFTSTADTTADEGQAYTYMVTAFDPDEDDDLNPQPLVYTAVVLPSWLTFTAGSNILVGIPQRTDVGDNPVSIMVTDGTYQVFHNFVIKVTSSNNLPVITSVPPSMVDNYSEYVYMISAYDADPTDVLTYGVELLPSWLTFDTESRIVSGIPQKVNVGMNNVILTVSDGFDIVRQEFTINVRDVNVAPMILSEPNDTALVDVFYTYLVEVVDYDNDPITLSSIVIPTWATFDPATRVLSGTPTTANLGPNRVYISVIAGVHNVPHEFYINVVNSTGFRDGVEFATRVYPNPAGIM